MRLSSQLGFHFYLFVVVQCLSQAQMIQASHSRVELLSDQAAPEQQLWLGVHFSLDRDWHIYWVNPGDSGQPPVLQWHLPPGFSADEIQWPRPERLKRASLTDYGYESEVVLLVPLHVARGINRDSKIDIGLDAKWLICRDVCVQDHAQLHLVLPAASQQQRHQAHADLFAKARERLPKPWPRLWKTRAVSVKDDFVVSVNVGKPIKAAEIFPLEPEQIENSAPQPLRATRQGAKIILKKSDQLLKPIHMLKGLLVLDGRDSYEIQATVTPEPAPAHGN